MPLPYAWLITEDLLASRYGDASEAGTYGPYGVDEALVAQLRAGAGLRFRLYDDDGELYYEGRYANRDAPSAGDFEPLDDFGVPNAGCTRIDYFDEVTSQWITL